VVPDVVDVDAFSNAPRKPRTGPREKIVAVSYLIPRKGLNYLVEAVRMLEAEGRAATVVVIGEGPDRSALEEQASGLPVTFLGSRPREEIVALVQAADVFAMPTLADPFGISAVEALAAGLPVVVTSASGTADFIAAHGGRVVPPADSRALFQALVDLLDDPNGVPPNTPAEVRAFCGFGAVAQRLDSIYRSLPGISPR
jgi:glycosyltransferase involved in cell wall biosynthesis